MIFEIIKTSNLFAENKIQPIANSFRMILPILEVRTLHSPEEFDALYAKTEGKWLEKGHDHFINSEGYISRYLDKTYDTWGIEINSLEELMELQKSIKDKLIIGGTSVNGDTPIIEIYDDWRE